MYYKSHNDIISLKCLFSHRNWGFYAKRQKILKLRKIANFAEEFVSKNSGLILQKCIFNKVRRRKLCWPSCYFAWLPGFENFFGYSSFVCHDKLCLSTDTINNGSSKILTATNMLLVALNSPEKLVFLAYFNNLARFEPVFSLSTHISKYGRKFIRCVRSFFFFFRQVLLILLVRKWNRLRFDARIFSFGDSDFTVTSPLDIEH